MTSSRRERLDITDEHVVIVPPLSTVSNAGPSPAARLFIERSQSIDATYLPAVAELDQIEALCRDLDGLPPAIQLAATRAFPLGVRVLRARLRRSLRALERRDRPAERHRSLLATIGGSYQLLTPRQQRSFASLSTFIGDFDLAAAMAVADPASSPDAVADDLAALVERSMVELTSSHEPAVTACSRRSGSSPPTG